MKLIKFSAVSFYTDGSTNPLMIDFQINAGDKIGVIGKTLSDRISIFKLLTGEKSPAAGNIYKKRGIKICSVHMDSIMDNIKNTPSVTALFPQEADIYLINPSTLRYSLIHKEIFEDYLTASKKTFVMISDDLYLLDKAATLILDIETNAFFNGDYTSYRKITAKNDMIRVQKTNWDDIWCSRDDITVYPKGDISITFDTVSKSIGDQKLINEMSFSLKAGDVVGVAGSNRYQEAAVLQLIKGEAPPDTGSVTIGSDAVLGVYSEPYEDLSYDITVMEALIKANGTLAENDILRVIEAIFDENGIEKKKLCELSYHEKYRFRLSLLALSGCNIIVIDNPEDTEKYYMEEIADFFAGFRGIILITSDDKYLLDRLANKILFFDNENYKVYEGSYTEFINVRNSRDEISSKKPAASSNLSRANSEKNILKSERGTPKRDILEIEREISNIESILDEYDKILSIRDPSKTIENIDEINEKYDQYNKKLRTLYDEWESSQ